MPRSARRRLAARLETLDRKLADRLEHPAPRLGRLAHGTHQALVDKVVEQVERLQASVRVRHPFDRRDIGAPDKDGQPRE